MELTAKIHPVGDDFPGYESFKVCLVVDPPYLQEEYKSLI